MSRRRVSRRAAGGGAAILLALVLLAALASVWSYAGPGPAARSGEMTPITLEKGAGLGEISGALKDAGIIRSANVFALAARLTGGAANLKAGDYEFRSRVSMRRVLADIRGGKTVRLKVTIPEGWTSDMVREALMAKPELTGVIETPAEGALLPDTYQLRRGESRAGVVHRMQAARDKVVNELWAARQSDLPLRNAEEAVILASVVEKETGLAEERPRVAAVFINRLRLGMALQSDPTIIYGITRGRPLGRGLRASELAEIGPYNSYKVTGLPPTPIANPGREALAAVLNPPKTDELFFVADGTGGHAFAATYEAHKRNVAQWREIERAKTVGAQ
jgi:UPF0755 protein